ncbi:MAG: DUF2330 domain-containing protein [Sedimentisphaerales bacterium]|nr:DUF2330 domain-containing protein [Sedimentisphaerales bacterium]
MKNTARCVLLAFTIGFLSTNVYADGKFYFYREGVPADTPYQRAILIFHENTETLILQSKYEISSSQSIDSLGWVVPIPSVPDITSFDAEIARNYFNAASRYTQPGIFAIHDLFGIAVHILFVLSFLSILILLLFFPILKKIGMSKEKWHKLANISFYTFLICFFVAFFSGAFIPFLSKQSSGEGVEIIKAGKAGIYDVKVIKSENADAILDWLKENNFNFNENDTDTFADYISRDWCFVVAKVQPESGTKKDKVSLDGLVAPLVLKFDTEKAIYPTALTATIGTETQILLYTLSDNKLDCQERLKLHAAQEISSAKFNPIFIVKRKEEADESLIELFKTLPPKMFICKFKDTLTSEQMKKDLVLENASDNKPYRKTKIVW